jgi:parallel beta-helix repeat protein
MTFITFGMRSILTLLKIFVIDGNKYHHNHKYAIDPHTGTYNMRITNNLVYENGSIGIICSLDCYDILTENNRVYDNPKTGIMLSRNTHDPIVRNNTISNSDRGIVITESPDNEVHNNVIYNVSNGILLVHPTSPDDGFTTGNRVYNNTVINADNGINVGNSNDNILANNTFQNITSFEYSLENGDEVIIED